MNGKSPILFPAEALEQLSDEAFWSYVHELASLASTGTDTEAETHPEEYLRCQLSHGDCLIPLAALYRAMLPPQGAGKGHLYALLPATPAWMVGLFAWRGETIAVIDLDAYLVSRNDPGSALPRVVHFFAREDEAIMPSEAMARTQKSEPHPMLLMADCSGLAIGLLVSTVGSTTSGHTCPPDRVPQGVAPTIHEMHEPQPEYSGRPGLPVLDLPTILADVVEQIRDACPP